MRLYFNGIFVKLSDFSYVLPPELIAQYPTLQRTDSRLLVLDKLTGKILHQKFSDLLQFIQPHDLLILNNTKVIPARLYGHKETGGKIEILIEKILNVHQAWVHCRASKRPQLNQKLYFGENIFAEVIEKNQDLLKLDFKNNHINTILSRYGHIPLPPYLNRAEEKLDQLRYQTVYAKHQGSCAAPTAGLHFDENLLARLNTAYITLHVGAGTFQSVRTENIENHQMHTEYAEISSETCEKIKQTKSRGGRVIAVGTTSVRTLESAAKTGELKAFSGETCLFIKPGFKFQCVDAVITNFHLPQSTLLMLVCAFAGVENILRAYQIAITEKYRFFSYGDAVFIK